MQEAASVKTKSKQQLTQNLFLFSVTPISLGRTPIGHLQCSNGSSSLLFVYFLVSCTPNI
jgi:hypothetical protein